MTISTTIYPSEVTFTLSNGDPLKAPRHKAIIIDLRDLDTDYDDELLELLEHYGVGCNLDSEELYDYSAVAIRRSPTTRAPTAVVSMYNRIREQHPTALILDAREILSNNQLLEDALCW